MKRTLVAVVLSLACGGVLAQAAGSSIPPNRQQGADAPAATDREQIKKDRLKARRDRRKMTEDELKLKKKAAAAAKR
jgi:hypothetical protein